MTVHETFIENAKLDKLIISRLMPDDDLFTSLKKMPKIMG